MKKIIALILALTCVLALVSCDGGSADHSVLETYKAAVDATVPSRATINITYTDTKLGVVLDGNYLVVYNADGTATVNYEYEKVNEIDSDSDELVSKVNGVVTVKADGTVTGSIDKKVTAATVAKINLDPAKMTYTVTRGILTAKIAAADVSAVLGVDIGADVGMTMTVSDAGKIGSISYNYATASGTASVVCFYE